MVWTCAVRGCFNKAGKGSQHSFHQFPSKDPEILRKWIVWMNRWNKDGSDWHPTTNHKICSAHFTDDDYYINYKGLNRHHIKADAVPSLNPPNPVLLYKQNQNTSQGASPQSAALVRPDPVNPHPYASKTKPGPLHHKGNSSQRKSSKYKVQESRDDDANMSSSSLLGADRAASGIMSQNALSRDVELAKACLQPLSSDPQSFAQRSAEENMPLVMPYDAPSSVRNRSYMKLSASEEEGVTVKLEPEDDEEYNGYNNTTGCEENGQATNGRYRANPFKMSSDVYMDRDETREERNHGLSPDSAKKVKEKIRHGIMKFQSIIEILVEQEPYLHLPIVNNFLEAIDKHISSDLLLQNSLDKLLMQRSEENLPKRSESLQKGDSQFSINSTSSNNNSVPRGSNILGTVSNNSVPKESNVLDTLSSKSVSRGSKLNKILDTLSNNSVLKGGNSLDSDSSCDLPQTTPVAALRADSATRPKKEPIIKQKQSLLELAGKCQSAHKAHAGDALSGNNLPSYTLAAHSVSPARIGGGKELLPESDPDSESDSSQPALPHNLPLPMPTSCSPPTGNPFTPTWLKQNHPEFPNKRK